ncbi:aspartate kinase [Mucilaginibacter myungsuensis]|uniref:Aspartokinase n=1 Tax=Mucilaginibacter myungsuensis TaxID=649104 RepID=A0A929PX31_9SPHI|nr:aspartate kinase [Mucilaginibacter myungsuensis]MBE9662764.1 aspartate kinase [Mucilaginibacter myungsuensis]MDN3598184.1 aspartate kinase [Mucilaginibacter myungsuensis]
MLVYKFGGASVKDAKGVINLANIVQQCDQPLLVVVSAMGKTTNALEKLTRAYVNGDHDMHSIFDEIKHFHYDIATKLFNGEDDVHVQLNNTFVEIEWMLEDEPQDSYDFIYDQIVSIGELAATRIVNAYLTHYGINSTWLDARGYILTDNTYREGVIDMEKSRECIQKDIPALLQKQVVITQGFIGGTSENFTTTLGREGSDYTAAVFAACLGAKSVTTWKDVPGILNADPKLFNDTVKFDELTYNEAIEMTYYGATVIHPKTIKPLQNAGIPLYVKSFKHPEEPGTVIKEHAHVKYIKPVIIVKQDQTLLSVSAKDHSFISEDHLGDIFRLFAKHHVHINIMQTSALSFSVCFGLEEEKFDALLCDLKEDFKVKYNNELTLYTLRHYDRDALLEVVGDKRVLLEQTSRNTVQVVVR